MHLVGRGSMDETQQQKWEGNRPKSHGYAPSFLSFLPIMTFRLYISPISDRSSIRSNQAPETAYCLIH